MSKIQTDDITWVGWEAFWPETRDNEDSGTMAPDRGGDQSSFAWYILSFQTDSLVSSRSNCLLFSSLDSKQRKHHGALTYFLITIWKSQSSSTRTDEKCHIPRPPHRLPPPRHNTALQFRIIQHDKNHLVK